MSTETKYKEIYFYHGKVRIKMSGPANIAFTCPCEGPPYLSAEIVPVSEEDHRILKRIENSADLSHRYSLDGRVYLQVYNERSRFGIVRVFDIEFVVSQDGTVKVKSSISGD